MTNCLSIRLNQLDFHFCYLLFYVLVVFVSFWKFYGKKRDKQKEKKMMKLICADEAQARKIKPINLCCWCNESACGSWVTCFYFHSSQNGANSSFNIHTHHAIYFLTFSSVGFFWWASETLRHFLGERRCKMRNRTILPIIWVFQFFFFSFKSNSKYMPEQKWDHYMLRP